MMAEYTGLYFLCVNNLKTASGRNQYAFVSYLPTRLSVKWCTVQHNYGGLTHRHGLDRCTIAVDRDDFCVFDGERVVTLELSLATLVFDTRVHLKLGCRTRAFALRLHFTLKARHVYFQITFQGDITCEVNRKSVGVVKLENNRPRNGVAIEGADILIEYAQALLQGFGKAFFFLAQRLFDLDPGLGEFRIGRTHFLHQRRHQLVEERLRANPALAVGGGAAGNGAH